MLIYRRTSLFDSTAQTLVNTVNCVGVMGKGIAQAFKQRDPEMFLAYKSICKRNLLEPGKLWLWQGSTQWVLNFPTKVHWRNPSRIEWIEAGLKKFADEYQSRGIKEASFPRLGCGNGGLEWEEVRPLMERHLKDLSIPVYIHDYVKDIGLPEHLEAVSRRLRSEQMETNTFGAFLSTLKRAVELAGGALIELETAKPFHAKMDDQWNLILDQASSQSIIEEDDLRGVWLSLLGGLVTKAKAGWSKTDAAVALLSMLSVLPQARPIEIEKPGGVRELAVELRLAASQTTLVPDNGPRSAWA